MEEALKDQAERADEPFQPISEPLDMATPTGEIVDTLITETAQCVRHYPLSAVAAAFGGGVLIGWLITHNLKARLYAGIEKRQQRVDEVKATNRAISIWENEGGAGRR